MSAIEKSTEVPGTDQTDE
jgi:magnesium transporter